MSLRESKPVPRSLLEAERRETPFRHWLVRGLLTDAELAEACEAVHDCMSEKGLWVRYANEDERKSASVAARHHPYLAPLFSRWLSPPFLAELQRAVGLRIARLAPDDTLWGGGLHVAGPGGLLGCHLDYALHPKLKPPKERRLNLLVYLLPEWREEWGGATELYRRDATTVGARVYPEPGLGVVWEPSDLSYHGMGVVAADCPVPRATAAVCYVAPARRGVVREMALFKTRR